MKTQETILDRVRKLLALSESDNAHEAAQAARMAQELLAKHDLDAAMIDAQESDEPDEEFVNFGEKGAPLEGRYQRLATWRTLLGTHLARANGCFPYLAGSKLNLVGRPSDGEKVRYLYTYFAHEVERLVKIEGEGCGNAWRNAWREGCVTGISEGLKKAKTDAQKKARDGANSDGALVRVETAIAKIDQRSKEVRAWAEANMRLGTRRTGGSTGGRDAYNRGQAAGRGIQHSGARGALAGAS